MVENFKNNFYWKNFFVDGNFFLFILRNKNILLGDGNIHINLTSGVFDENVLKAIEPYIYERVSEFRGSISAEHGIGFLKSKYLKYSKTQNEISTMRKLKQLMDPNGILNPHKILEKTNWNRYIVTVRL